jgi:hypothetical protein
MTDTETIQWQQLRPGLGREWNFDADGPLVGHWVGEETVPLDPTPQDPRTEAIALTFAVQGTGEDVFVWQSYELSKALEQAGVGDLLRITMLGRDSFTTSDGPRTVKRYRVERAQNVS